MKQSKMSARLTCFALALAATGSYANSGSEVRSDDTASQALLSAPAGLSKDAAALSPDSTKALRIKFCVERGCQLCPPFRDY